MATNSDLKCSRQQRPSMIMKDKVLPNQAKLGVKHKEKFRGRYYVSQPCVNRPHELRQRTNGSISTQPKTSRNHWQQSVEAKVTKGDELVKHMSYLPGYLRHLEREESIQDKALNIGVLDWARLEKWKCNKKDTPASNGNSAPLAVCNTSSKVAGSSTSSTAIRNETLTRQSKQIHSPGSSSESSSNDRISRGGKQAIQSVMRFQDFETSTNSGMDGQKKVKWTYKSLGKINSEVILEKEKTMGLNQKINSKVGDWSMNSRYDGNLAKPMAGATACDGEARITVQKVQDSDIKRKALDSNDSLSNRASSAKPKVVDHYSPKENKDVANGKSKKKLEELQASAIDLSSRVQTGKKEKVILLLPRALSRNCSPEDSRRSFTANLIEADQSSFTDICSEDVHTSQLHPEIPHSCLPPSSIETAKELGTMAQPLSKTQCVDVPSDVSNASVGLHKSPVAPQKNILETTDVNMVETLKALNRETAELESGRGRHPSPNRRFSFSFRRMSRSFSFKESSSIPQVSSTYVSVKSGPITSDCSVSLENTNRERASTCSRGRSSPLRRMLDPILKSKAQNPLHVAETDRSSKVSSNSYGLKTLSTIELLQNEKHDVQAFLQLTTRNGLPFFRFVVNNKSSIFAAPMKNLISPEKKDLGCHYTFYTIDESKKKIGIWIDHANKEKSCGYMYNVVGQMKVHSSSLDYLTEQNSNSQYTVSESVLFGVELRQADQPSMGFMPTRELAAAVVKKPNDIPSLGMRHCAKYVNMMEKGFSGCLPDNERSCNLGASEPNHNVTIVLPDGIHGLPNRGVPSPLIQRWKSGGSCDCGGWDVGCHLQVLCNEKRCCKISRTSEGCFASDHFELFVQGGGGGEAQEKKPVFSFLPVENGMYKVQFSPSLSSLQAFFICVTLLSCQKSSDSEEENSLSDKMVSHDPLGVSGGIEKTKAAVPKEAPPVKYTPSPPFSPVGRV